MSDFFGEPRPRVSVPGHAIDDYEHMVGTTFRPEWRAFIERWNGLDPSDWTLDEGWMRGEGFDEAYLDAREEAEEVVYGGDGEEGLDPCGVGVGDFYGLRTGNEHTDMPVPDDNGGMHFYDVRLCRHGYVIAHDGMGNPYVHVTRGTLGGAVLIVEHESYYGGLDRVFAMNNMDAEERAAVPFVSFEAATTDEFWTAMLDMEFASLGAHDFPTMLAKRIALERGLIETLAPRFWRGRS